MCNMSGYFGKIPASVLFTPEILCRIINEQKPQMVIHKECSAQQLEVTVAAVDFCGDVRSRSGLACQGGLRKLLALVQAGLLLAQVCFLLAASLLQLLWSLQRQ